MHRKKLHKQILQEMLTFHRSNVSQKRDRTVKFETNIYASRCSQMVVMAYINEFTYVFCCNVVFEAAFI